MPGVGWVRWWGSRGACRRHRCLTHTRSNGRGGLSYLIALLARAESFAAHGAGVQAACRRRRAVAWLGACGGGAWSCGASLEWQGLLLVGMGRLRCKIERFSSVLYASVLLAHSKRWINVCPLLGGPSISNTHTRQHHSKRRPGARQQEKARPPCRASRRPPWTRTRTGVSPARALACACARARRAGAGCPKAPNQCPSPPRF